MNLENKIESILLFKNEPVAISELSKMLDTPKDKIQESISRLQKEYENKGIVIVTDGREVSLGTNPHNSQFIVQLQKDELSRDLGRAGLETLAIVLYKGPIARREIDYIRGVNSAYILRTLLIRGLVERDGDGRSYAYRPTLELLKHLGVTKIEDLPEYENAFNKLTEFVENPGNSADE